MQAIFWLVGIRTGLHQRFSAWQAKTENHKFGKPQINFMLACQAVSKNHGSLPSLANHKVKANKHKYAIAAFFIAALLYSCDPICFA